MIYYVASISMRQTLSHFTPYTQVPVMAADKVTTSQHHLIQSAQTAGPGHAPVNAQPNPNRRPPQIIP